MSLLCERLQRLREPVFSEFPAGVAELADALDSKFRNQRFHLINSDQTSLAISTGKIDY